MSSGLNGRLIKQNTIPIPSLSGVTGTTKYVGTDASGNPGVFSFPTSAAQYGNIVFVSKNGNDSTGTRTRMGLPYLTVQGAINNATSNDSIVIYEGVYVENIAIGSKNINFVSVGKVIIEGIGTITSSNVSFDNMKLKNTSGINFSVTSSNITLKNSEMETNLTYHTSASGTSTIFSNNLITNNNLTNGTYTSDEPFMHIIKTTFTI